MAIRPLVVPGYKDERMSESLKQLETPANQRISTESTAALDIPDVQHPLNVGSVHGSNY
jgi:hypothetical protein